MRYITLAIALFATQAYADCAMDSVLGSALNDPFDCPQETYYAPEPNPPSLESPIGILYDQYDNQLSESQQRTFDMRFSWKWKSTITPRLFDNAADACRAQAKLELPGRTIYKIALRDPVKQQDSRDADTKGRDVLNTLDSGDELVCMYYSNPSDSETRKLWFTGKPLQLHQTPPEECEQYGQYEQALLETTGYWEGQVAVLIDAVPYVGDAALGPDGRFDISYKLNNESPLHTDCIVDEYGISRCALPVSKSQLEYALGEEIQGPVYVTFHTSWPGERWKSCINFGG